MQKQEKIIVLFNLFYVHLRRRKFLKYYLSNLVFKRFNTAFYVQMICRFKFFIHFFHKKLFKLKNKLYKNIFHIYKINSNLYGKKTFKIFKLNLKKFNKRKRKRKLKVLYAHKYNIKATRRRLRLKKFFKSGFLFFERPFKKKLYKRFFYKYKKFYKLRFKFSKVKSYKLSPFKLRNFKPFVYSFKKNSDNLKKIKFNGYNFNFNIKYKFANFNARIRKMFIKSNLLPFKQPVNYIYIKQKIQIDMQSQFINNSMPSKYYFYKFFTKINFNKIRQLFKNNRTFLNYIFILFNNKFFTFVRFNAFFYNFFPKYKIFKKKKKILTVLFKRRNFYLVMHLYFNNKLFFVSVSESVLEGKKGFYKYLKYLFKTTKHFINSKIKFTNIFFIVRFKRQARRKNKFKTKTFINFYIFKKLLKFLIYLFLLKKTKIKIKYLYINSHSLKREKNKKKRRK